jgi:hypothetical protein
MKVVYCHNREIEPNPGVMRMDDAMFFGTVAPRGGSTVAMEAIQSWLLDTLEQGSTIVRKVGIAKCSTDDNYCKKTGRELAQSRLKQTTLTVVNIVKMGPSVTVFFEDDNGNLFEVKKTNDLHCARLIRMLND